MSAHVVTNSLVSRRFLDANYFNSKHAVTTVKQAMQEQQDF